MTWLKKTEQEVEKENAALEKEMRQVIAQHPEPCSLGELIAAVRGQEHLFEIICNKITEIKTKVGIHEARLNHVEARAELKYMGAWKDTQQYESGAFVTHQGGLWFCLECTNSRPGHDRAWQLAVKSGRA